MANAERWLIVPDCHVPYHSEHAFGECLYAAKQLRPHGVVLLGDFADCYAVSSHDRDPSRKAKLADELAHVKAELAKVVKACGPQLASRHYLMGNHEHRLQRYLWTRAPELHGLVSYEAAVGLKASGWRVTDYGKMLRVGKMHFTHDLGKAGSGAAKQAMQDVQGNVVIGHTHRMEVYYAGNAKGEQHVGATLGWLGDPATIEYRPDLLVKRQWTHGWGTMDLYKNGNVRLHTHPLF